MGAKKLYAVWDHEKPLGEHTCQEWEELLSVPRQSIRDYAREGRIYKNRFKIVLVENVEEASRVNQDITVQELEQFKRSLKIGAKFVYESHRKDFVLGTRLTSEKVAVAKKFPHIVELVSLENPKRSVTMTYAELLVQKKNRALK